MNLRSILPLLLLLAATRLPAQKSIADSAISANLIHANFALQFPGGDLSEQFGMNSLVGAAYLHKTSSNWVFGFEGNFMFGDQVKNENEVLSLIETSDGNLIDMEGIYANYNFNERGFTAFVKAGKVIPAWGPNSNSGFLVTLGAGYLQHKIYIEHRDKTAPQITGDYLKGYDELKNGPAANLFAGYLFLGNANKVNFYAGIDLTLASTSYVRPYSFNRMEYTSGRFTDFQAGLKIGWIIPVYRRAPKEYYYY
ncbi:MAG: hypothetical protein JNL22_07105 [Bacteroidales bacterium]|nr:hypothetical protein [Bacteroidales bacterium]